MFMYVSIDPNLLHQAFNSLALIKKFLFSLLHAGLAILSEGQSLNDRPFAALDGNWEREDQVLVNAVWVALRVDGEGGPVV